MTREEQLDWLCRLRSEIYVYMPKEWLIPMNNALDMSIKALEQEPCEDAISRQAVIKVLINNGVHFCDMVKITSDIKDLPSVSPQEPNVEELQKRSYLEGFHEALKMINNKAESEVDV